MLRTFLTVCAIAGLAVLQFAHSGIAAASQRVALVVGNAAYQNAPVLANPHNDATAISAKLKSLGFEVVEGYDLDLRGTRRKIREFVNKLGSAEIALFYYAGHGLQVKGKNYLIPVDAALESSLDLEFEAVPMNLVLGAMEDRVETNVLFLDACRDNPLARSLRRSLGQRSSSIGRGLAELNAGQGTLISFATQPGAVASDGNTGNSPYTAALVKHLGTPGESLTDSMIRVRNEVIQVTNKRQVPWEHSSLTGRVVLKQKPAEPPKPVPAPQVSAPSRGDLEVELMVWDTVKNANSALYFETYLKQYPNGVFAEFARLKIADLENKVAEQELRRETRQADQGLADPTVEAEVTPADEDSSGSAAAGIGDEPETADESVELALAKEQDAVEETRRSIDPLARLTDREAIREVQERLYEHNFSPGKADGVPGNRTRSAVRAFEEANKLAVTGQLTEGLLQRLRDTPAPDDWAAIGFLVSKRQIFERANLSTRRDAEQAMRSDCPRCNDVLLIAKGECGALAMSNSGWGWAVRKSQKDTTNAALGECRRFGSGCEIKSLVCTGSAGN